MTSFFVPKLIDTDHKTNEKVLYHANIQRLKEITAKRRLRFDRRILRMSEGRKLKNEFGQLKQEYHYEGNRREKKLDVTDNPLTEGLNTSFLKTHNTKHCVNISFSVTLSSV